MVRFKIGTLLNLGVSSRPRTNLFDGFWGKEIDPDTGEVTCELDTTPIQPGDLDYPSFAIGGDHTNYLHLCGIQVFSRHQEDADHGIKISMFNDDIVITDDITGNPSLRRDAVSLYFNSEGCKPIRMDVIQHKGISYVEFHEWDGTVA